MTWKEFVERLDEYNDSETSLDEATLLQLQELHTTPLDINTLTREDLLKLPFLSEDQVDDIIGYQQRNIPIQSLGELLLIPTLSKDEREMLRIFLSVNPTSASANTPYTPSFNELLNNANNELVYRTDIPLYTTAGYGIYPDSVLAASPNKVYRGDPLHHTFRYSLSSMNHLFAGIQMEKDPGERGIDYFSGYLMIKNIGIVKSAILGDYRISFGQGLAVNTGMKFGKMMTNTTDRIDVGISKHSSSMESGYFRGGAATIKLSNIELSAFLSYMNQDGTMRNDALGISTLKTDGLHRTVSERNRKNNLSTTNFGGNIHWSNNQFTLSATAVATHFSLPLMPVSDTPSSLYRKYNAAGQDFFVGSIAYGYRNGKVTFSGETALSTMDHQSGFASINTIRWRADGHNILSLSGRWYGAQFVSINGRTLSENSSVQNEQGALISWTNTSLRNVKFYAYADIMHFPWLKYQVSAPSYAYEGLAQALISPRNSWRLLLRYRMKTKQKDYTYKNTDITDLRYRTSHNLKVQLSNFINPQWTLCTTATAVIATFADTSSKGLSLSEGIRWKSATSPLHAGLSLTLFSTDSYDGRIYSYEPTLLYSYGMTSLYHHGIRTSLLASIPLFHKSTKNSLSINTRFSSTILTDGNTIGSGLDALNSNHKEDLELQLIYKFPVKSH